MLVQKINEDELVFMEQWFTPMCLTESLFSNFDNLGEFNEKFGSVRLYQRPMISNEALIDFDETAKYHKLNKKEKFQLRKNVADIYNLGARKYGKSLCTLKIDIPLSSIYDERQWGCLYSIDEKRLRGIADDVKMAFDFHPIFKMYNYRCSFKPEIKFINKNNGWRLQGVNMTLKGKNPGEQFFQIHADKFWGDEVSFEIEQVHKRRKEAESELGAIIRLAGMTDFAKYSPIGKIFDNIKNKESIINLPQFCIAKGSKILMEDFTTKNIEDIEIGDIILTIPEMKPFKLTKTKVLNKIPKGIKQTYKLKVNNNILDLTTDHKFLVKNKSEDKLWLNLKQIKKYHLAYNLKYINNLHDYYEGMFLGLLEIEGSFKNKNTDKATYSIGQKDEKECLEFVLNKIGIKYTKYFDNKDSLFAYYYLKVSNRQYINSLYTKLEKNLDCQFGFISGCIIGDGCVNIYYDKKKKKQQLSIGQKNKVKLIDKILKVSKIKHNKIKRKDEFYCYFFPRLSFPFHAPKAKKFKKYLNNIIGTSLNSINKSKIDYIRNKKQEVYDLTTEVGSFIANGIVVHNCNPYWDEKEKQDRIETYGGEEALLYKIYVKGETVPDAHTEFDMERIDCCYNRKKKIKRFELKKSQFSNFENLIIVDRPKNAERILILGDIGDGAGGSDINIFSEVGEKYYWLYNIILYKMTEDEQYKLFNYLVEQTQANILGFDCGEGCGRGLYDRFEKRGFKDNLVWYAGNKKVAIGFEKDADGQYVRDKKAQLIIKEEFMSEWSVKRLKVLLYEGRIHLPFDFKLDGQLSSVVCLGSGTRKTYECISDTGDHLFDCFKVFAIAQWLKKDFNATPNMVLKMGLGVTSGRNRLKKLLDNEKEHIKEMLNKIHEGKIINCEKNQFDKYVGKILRDRANYYTFRGDTTRARIAVLEFKRLSKKFENIKGE